MKTQLRLHQMHPTFAPAQTRWNKDELAGQIQRPDEQVWDCRQNLPFSAAGLPTAGPENEIRAEAHAFARQHGLNRKDHAPDV